MSVRGSSAGGNSYHSLAPLHHTERGTPMQFLKSILWDVAAVLGAFLLVAATGAGIAFAVFVLLFCAV